ncbi:alanine racemase [Nitrosomonas sp.]|uniref:alanine racemase n=1 Tax=Nitrosomonas sp. TaxID=42353 RepID=UPI0025E48220|nr:alanine racemase [Nitrosomonas sp.]
MPRPTQAFIDLSALAHNLTIVRQHAPYARIMAVLKANAYGHGLLHTASALKDVDGFALLELDAAICLRDAGYRQPILLLEGFFSTEELALFEQYQLSAVIHHTEQIAMLSDSKHHKLDLFIKINTGMNRLGLALEQFPQTIKKLTGNQHANRITLMTHFACADDPAEEENVMQQLECFETVTKGCSYPRSLANSAAIIRYPEIHSDWVRPGIMLYGASPFPDKTALELNLQPAMTLSSRIIAVHELKTGDRVGYHGLFQADYPMRIGIVACGYADGYPRHAPTNTPVLVNNQRSRLLGRVSMDMLAVDLTGIENAGLNSPVILWGEEISVDEVAQNAETTSYELLCALAPRVERIVSL